MLGLNGRTLAQIQRWAQDTTVSPRCTAVNGRQYIREQKRAQWTPNTELKITRMAIAPNVDRKHRHFTGDINVRCNVHKNDGIIPLDSQYSPVAGRLLKVLQGV